MRIELTSVFVSDQAKALQFYSEVLGFVIKRDFSVGEFRWLTVVSLDGHDDVELLLEPNANPTAKEYQKALHSQGIASVAFAVDSVEDEATRLRNLGVDFTGPVTKTDTASFALFDDTCGNLIQIYETADSHA